MKLFCICEASFNRFLSPFVYLYSFFRKPVIVHLDLIIFPYMPGYKLSVIPVFRAFCKSRTFGAYRRVRYKLPITIPACVLILKSISFRAYINISFLIVYKIFLPNVIFVRAWRFVSKYSINIYAALIRDILRQCYNLHQDLLH